jgi:hypothetical protein
LRETQAAASPNACPLLKTAMLREVFRTHQCNLSHLVSLFLLLIFLAASAPDPHEVTNRGYLRFIQATAHPPPEYWSGGHYPAGAADEPVVLVNWHDAVSYCRWAGRRLPTVDEWTSACKAGRLKKLGDIWEWTSTDVPMGNEPFKALCGPRDSCDCSHRYHTDWKNEVKGFRCFPDSALMTWLPLFSTQELLS